METLQKEFEIELRWRSFELRPKGTPIPEHYRQRVETEGRPRMKMMAREHYGLEKVLDEEREAAA